MDHGTFPPTFTVFYYCHHYSQPFDMRESHNTRFIYDGSPLITSSLVFMVSIFTSALPSQYVSYHFTQRQRWPEIL